MGMVKASTSAASRNVRSSHRRKCSSLMRREDRFAASFRKRIVLNGRRTVRLDWIRCNTSGSSRAIPAIKNCGARNENISHSRPVGVVARRYFESFRRSSR